MRKLLITTAVCALSLAAIGTTSAAAPSSYETQITILDAGPGPEGFWIGGVLESEKNRCRAGREMSFVVQSPPKHRRVTTVLDEGLVTSNHGGWAFLGEQKFSGALKIKVEKRVLGNGDICKGASQGVT